MKKRVKEKKMYLSGREKIIDKKIISSQFKDVTIVLCGEAGQGIDSIFGFLTMLLKNEGYNLFATKEYMSRVRGGENSATLRISNSASEGFVERIDLLLALDDGAIDHLSSRISDKTIIIGDKDNIATEHKFFNVPFIDIASNVGSKIFANTVATATLLGIFNADINAFYDLIKKRFSNKTSDIIEKNIESARQGYNAGQKIIKENYKIAELFSITKDSEIKNHILMQGAESIGLGAIAGGCNFISAYPMSPSTGVLIYLASKKNDFDIVVEQAEDEISAINMTIGAWYAGARALANTSGGGFSLMCEGVSLSGIMESPLVIHIAQRPGPATGLPTRTAQEDLELALYSGHGEFCRLIYAPSNVIEGFYLTQKAFNMADKYQIPVFVLTDQYFMDTLHNIKSINIDSIKIEKQIVETDEKYQRYELNTDGISPRGIPGYGKGLVCVDSDEHDESGHITESMTVRNNMMNKRLKRFHELELNTIMPTMTENENYSILIISWGTTYGSVKEAVEKLKNNEIKYIHYSQVYPLHPKTASWIKNAKKTIVIENNATGQFSKLIRRETGLSTEKILKDDGMPFSVEELFLKIGELLK